MQMLCWRYSLSLPTWNAIKPGFSVFSVTFQNNVSLSIPQSNSTDFTKVYIIRISEDMRSPNNLFSNVSCRSFITHTASSECVHKQTFSASSFIWSKKDFPLEIRLSGHSGLLLRSVDPIEVQIRTLCCVCRKKGGSKKDTPFCNHRERRGFKISDLLCEYTSPLHKQHNRLKNIFSQNTISH